MNAAEMNTRLYEAKKSKIKVYPCHNLRASNVGHPCERYLYLLMTKWEEQEPHSVGLQSIFDLGNTLEDHTIKNLKEAGFEVLTPTQRSWAIDIPHITGREDVRIKEEDGQLYPVEIKGLEHNEWERLNNVEDFFRSKKHYVRAYPDQLYIYMWKFEKPKGYFALTSKTTGETKMIEVPFDWEHVDELFKKAERIYKAIASKQIPNACDELSVCDKCSLKRVCGLNRNIPADIETDGELDELIAKKESLRSFTKEFEETDEEIKRRIGDRVKVITGNYIVERKCTHYPEQTKTTPAKDTWRMSIKKL